MRVTELCVQGTKRKAMKKETPEEKAARDRAVKKMLKDSLWLAAAATTTLSVGRIAGTKEAC